MYTNTLPEKFLEKLHALVPKEKLPEVFDTFSLTRPTTFRVNALKTTIENVTGTLTQKGFIIEQLPWYSSAFILKNKTLRELTETKEYQEGFLYIQNLSSMIPVLVLDPKPQEKILDIAAAPGSKTTQIANHMQNTGEIIANDISRIRLYKLGEILLQQGVTNVKITRLPGQTIWQHYPEYFDKTLVDAPCSMEGRFSLNDPKSYTHWTQKKVKVLAARQQYLLRSAISATKPGGIIVYSTCTLSPEENEGVIDWVVKKEGNAIELESITIPKLQLEPGITKWHKNYDKSMRLTARVFPTQTLEGFFIANIRKKRSTLSPISSLSQ